MLRPAPSNTPRCPECGDTLYTRQLAQMDLLGERNTILVECTNCGGRGHSRLDVPRAVDARPMPAAWLQRTFPVAAQLRASKVSP